MQRNQGEQKRRDSRTKNNQDVIHKESFISLFRSFTLGKFLSAPFTYAMMIPAVIFHIGLEVFHQTCFRLCDIPRVDRKKYFIYDRIHLSYLNWFEKLNCTYCSYFNGLMGYASEIAGRTERFWCPIKHARNRAQEHGQYKNFFDYSDGETYRKDLDEVRKYKSDC